MSHGRVENVSGGLQHCVQVAENLERVIGGQITRRVFKISVVALATFFCQRMDAAFLLDDLSPPSS